MEVILIRHTSVDVPPGVCYGQTDVPLKPTFEQEAAITQENLKNYLPFDHVYIVLVVPADVVRFEALEPLGYNQAGSEQRVGGLNRLIAVIDRNNHGNLPPYPVKQGEARSPA